MPNEKISIQKTGDRQKSQSEYQRSSISFPYFDLSQSLNLAHAISTNVGRGECTDEQLAPWVDLSAKSSGYRARVSAARLFGLLEPGKEKDHRLSALGLECVDEVRAREGKAKAFVTAPLFKSVFDRWNGQQLPAPAVLERAIIDLGVAEKQAARARQTLERSAQEAGFFENGKDRLVYPGIKKSDSHTGVGARPGSGTDDGRNKGGASDLEVDPIISGLLKRLPQSGSVWSADQRKLWLDLLSGSFELIYKDKENGSID